MVCEKWGLVEMSLDVIKDKDDTLFVAFMRDISDEVKAEEELIQSWIRAFVGASGKGTIPDKNQP